jgi:hypothetical protein
MSDRILLEVYEPFWGAVRCNGGTGDPPRWLIVSSSMGSTEAYPSNTFVSV